MKTKLIAHIHHSPKHVLKELGVYDGTIDRLANFYTSFDVAIEESQSELKSEAQRNLGLYCELIDELRLHRDKKVDIDINELINNHEDAIRLQMASFMFKDQATRDSDNAMVRGTRQVLESAINIIRNGR